VAFGREFMDDTVHTREDIEKATGGLSVIGMIPRIQFHGALANGNGNGRRNGRFTRVPSDGLGHLEERLVTGRDPRNPVSEAYRSLRTNLTFVTPDHPPKTLVMTSAMPQEGKSTTSANLAVTLCQMGLKVLLVDTDLRRGVLHALFKVPREPGLSNILAGQATLAESIRRVDLGENGTLNLISTGVLPPNPSELLSSHRMTKLIDELGEAYDTVILDCPPLNVVTDAAIVGARVDGVIVVARASTTEKGALAFATDLLRRVRAPVVGTVLNDLDHRRDSRYSRGYGRYGYYHGEYYGETD
jgi:capsular exopolysaccharide synthesis family protein